MATRSGPVLDASFESSEGSRRASPLACMARRCSSWLMSLLLLATCPAAGSFWIASPNYKASRLYCEAALTERSDLESDLSSGKCHRCYGEITRQRRLLGFESSHCQDKIAKQFGSTPEEPALTHIIPAVDTAKTLPADPAHSGVWGLDQDAAFVAEVFAAKGMTRYFKVLRDSPWSPSRVLLYTLAEHG